MKKEDAISAAEKKLANISAKAKSSIVAFAIAHEMRDQYDRVHYVWRAIVEPLAQFTRIAIYPDAFAKSIGLHIPERDKSRTLTFDELIAAATDEGNSHRIAVVHNPLAKPAKRSKSQE